MSRHTYLSMLSDDYLQNAGRGERRTVQLKRLVAEAVENLVGCEGAHRRRLRLRRQRRAEEARSG
jgi:hypothetical protein